MQHLLPLDITLLQSNALQTQTNAQVFYKLEENKSSTLIHTAQETRIKLSKVGHADQIKINPL